MNKYLSNIARFAVLSLVLGSFVPLTANAQSTLQSAPGGLQQQTGQAQSSVSTQNQTGTLQNNDGSSVLNQDGTKSLGVVSDPKQTTPDTTVRASNTLTADITKQEDSGHTLAYVAAVSSVIVVVGIFVLINTSSKPKEFVVEAPVIKPEPLKRPKKSSGKRRNKKKARQR